MEDPHPVGAPETEFDEDEIAAALRLSMQSYRLEATAVDDAAEATAVDGTDDEGASDDGPMDALATAMAAVVFDDAPLSIEDELICPITLDRLVDPVMTLAGHTYERAAIEAWFAGGRTDDPSTGAELSDCTLVPNHMVRRVLRL